MVTTEIIKELRDETGISIMQCKRALEEADGDMEKAKIILKKQSAGAATKKSDRELGAGFLALLEKDKKATIVPLFCETDFVAKNEDFIKTANEIAELAIGEDSNVTEKSTEKVNELIQKIGENIKVGEIKIITGNIGSYVHNGQIASIVSLKEDSSALAKEIAMHIVAMKPAFQSESDISEETKRNAREIFQKEVEEESKEKPEDIKAKILEGKMKSYFKDQVLMNQSFIKDPTKTIEVLLKENNNSLETFILEQI